MNNILYPPAELWRARENRERVRDGYGNTFYHQQEVLREHWVLGEPIPQGLIVDGMPSYSFNIIMQASRRRIDND